MSLVDRHISVCEQGTRRGGAKAIDLRMTRPPFLSGPDIPTAPRQSGSKPSLLTEIEVDAGQQQAYDGGASGRVLSRAAQRCCGAVWSLMSGSVTHHLPIQIWDSPSFHPDL